MSSSCKIPVIFFNLFPLIFESNCSNVWCIHVKRCIHIFWVQDLLKVEKPFFNHSHKCTKAIIEQPWNYLHQSFAFTRKKVISQVLLQRHQCTLGAEFDAMVQPSGFFSCFRVHNMLKTKPLYCTWLTAGSFPCL